MEATMQQVIPIFDGKKYVFRQIKMTTILKTQKLTTRKHKFYEGSFPRYFVVKAVLRRISEETRFVVICLS